MLEGLEGLEGYDRLTDKVDRVFDLIKKIVERVSDVIIQDITDVNSQVLFPLPPNEQEENLEESYPENNEDVTDSDDCRWYK